MAANSNTEDRDRSRSPVRTIEVCIHDLSGRRLCKVHMPNDYIVAWLCNEIQEPVGEPIELQKLLFDGKVLDIHLQLATYKIQKRADITFIRLQKPPGCYNCNKLRCRNRHWIPWFCAYCKQPRYCLKEVYDNPEEPDVCEECFNKSGPCEVCNDITYNMPCERCNIRLCLRDAHIGCECQVYVDENDQ